MWKVGEKIREVRRAKRLRQKALAELVGLSPGALTNFEKGRRPISLDWLQKIADTLDTPVAYFLPDNRGSGTPAPGDPRERRLVNAWRHLQKDELVSRDVLALVEHLGRALPAPRRKRRER